jgi:hypothetical protein
MEARSGAHFPPESQIYFSYGKLSNRTLLVRYGFSLEDNPYEHVWVKFKLGKHIEAYPDLFDLIQSKGLPVNYKVKLKAYTYALETVVYFRMCAWKATHHGLEDIFCVTDVDRELTCLEQVRTVYLECLEMYEGIKEDLTDGSLGYHGYFARVYNLEQKKIIRLQLELTDYLSNLLAKIKTK